MFVFLDVSCSLSDLCCCRKGNRDAVRGLVQGRTIQDTMASKGQDLLSKAIKKRDGFSLFGSSQKFEDAADLFQQAGNAFKQGKEWKQAAEAYEQAAACFAKVDNNHDSAQMYLAAALAYRQSRDFELAVKLLERVVEAYRGLGRFQIAAKHTKEIAEIYERCAAACCAGAATRLCDS